MNSFAKQHGCPTSATLSAYGAGTLSFLARRSVSEHLAACEFCHAESSLLARARAAADDRLEELRGEAFAASGAPPMPLALRLLAESLLQDRHDNAIEKRAA